MPTNQENSPAKKKKGATKPSAQDVEAAKEYEEMRNFVSVTVVVQLAYITGRTLWHVGLPWLFGVQQFVPLVLELFAAELLVTLLFWAGGGFGPKGKERPWMLNAYNVLAMLVLAKCITDVYVYNFSPNMWRHYSPGRPWGVPQLIAANLPQRLLAWGVQPALVAKGADIFEKAADLICLLSCFRGVRAGKQLMLARRMQARSLKQKKED